MAVFQYITRGTQSAQGKQKIYFCAHPDDYEKYLEKVLSEVLDILARENNQSCAFYYLEDANAERDQEFAFSLKEMNLFIMPITTRLLTTANPALDIEFNFATENGIPVMPLMMEPGLEEIFNEKCGDIHFLDPNSQDITAISYEEKLTKYLTSVLIGDELAEKIRNAFDAYIFLSYRKKDRQYVQELMRLIHRIPNCRDIAIWYDEFLTPGENFNDSIKEALDKSQLFALAVTPNLVNEENYVMRIEYPMAKAAGKPILPAELVETNRQKLAERYVDIPECIRSDDERALTTSLEQALRGISLRENDDDPEHNFLIGLAYLGGIDVERNTTRALELITLAANEGLTEAIERLVSIYRNGEAGERDYRAAMEWQRKLIARREELCLEDRDSSSAGKYFQTVFELGNYRDELCEVEEARKVYGEMLLASREIYEDWLFRPVAVSYSHYGSIYTARGNMYDAEEFYSKALRIAERLAEKTETVEARRGLAFSCERLGTIYLSRGEPSKAQELFVKSLRIAGELVSENGMMEARRELLAGNERLGAICESRCEITEAEAFYLASLKIAEELANEKETPQAWRDLRGRYQNLGAFFLRHEKTDDAVAFYRKAITIGEDLACRGEIGCTRNEIAEDYLELGEFCASFGKTDDAKEYYLSGLRIHETLASEAGTAEEWDRLSRRFQNIGEYYWRCGRTDDAEDFLRKMVKFAEIASNDGTVEMRKTLSLRYRVLGDVCWSRDKHEAQGFYLKELNIRETLAREIGTMSAWHDLSSSYRNLGYVCMECNYLQKAETYCRKGLQILKRLDREIREGKTRNSFSVGHDGSNASETRGKTDDVGKVACDILVDRVVNEFDRLIENELPISVRQGLCASYGLFGEIYQKRNKLHQAKKYYLKALEVAETITQEDKSETNRRALEMCYRKLRDICIDCGKTKEAFDFDVQLALLELDEEIYEEELPDEDPDDP